MRQFDLSDIHIFLLLSSVGIKRLSCGYYLSQKIDSQKVKKSILTSFRRKPESRIKELVPGFRRDDAWTPVFFALLRPQPSGSGPQFHQK